MLRDTGEPRGIKPPHSHEELSLSAREAILRDGHYEPTIFIDGSKQSMSLPIGHLMDIPELKYPLFFEMGSDAATVAELGELQQVSLVFEAWASRDMNPDGTPRVMPADDPNRIEILTVNSQDAKTRESRFSAFEMIRTAPGDLDLLDITEELAGNPDGESEPIQSPTLDAFLDGYEQEKAKAKPSRWGWLRRRQN